MKAPKAFLGRRVASCVNLSAACYTSHPKVPDVSPSASLGSSLTSIATVTALSSSANKEIDVFSPLAFIIQSGCDTAATRKKKLFANTKCARHNK